MDYLFYITLVILLLIPINRNKKMLKNNFDIGTLIDPKISSLINKLNYLNSLTRFNPISLNTQSIINSLINININTLNNAYSILTGLNIDDIINQLNIIMVNYNYKDINQKNQITITINNIIDILRYIETYIPQLTH